MITILGKYRFEGNAKDSSGNLNDGVVYGPTYADRIIGKGANFVHTNSAGSPTNYGIALGLLNTDMSLPFFVSLFFNSTLNISNIQTLFSLNKESGTTYKQLRLVSNSLIITNNTSASVGNYAISNNVVYHVCAAWTVTGCKLYVNGVLRVNYTGADTGTISPTPISIGAFNAGVDSTLIRSFQGIIDEFIIGTGEPTETDIRRMMLGLHPIHQQRHQNSYEKFRDNVLRDGGTFEDSLFREEFSKQHSIVRKEATTLVVPGAYKSGIIYGMNTLNGDLVPLTFTRASPATYFDKAKQLQVVGNHIPRINYDEFTGALRGYLFENSVIQELSNSLFDGNITGWTTSGTGIIYNTATSSNGRPFITIYKTEALASTYLSGRLVNSTANTRYAVRIKVRAGTSTNISLGLGTSNDPGGENLPWGGESYTGHAILNGPGSITSNNGIKHISGLSTTEDTTIEFYRTYVNAGIAIRLYIFPGGSSSSNINNTSLISTPQMEINSLGVCTSQIDSSNGIVTRATELLVGPSSIINNTAFSMFMYASKFSNGNNFMFSRGNDGRVWYNTSSPDTNYMYDGNSVISADSIPNGTPTKVVSSIGAEGMKINVNNSSVNKGTYSGVMGTGSNVYFCGSQGSANRIQNHIKAFAIIPRQLTDAEHIALTTL